MKPSSSKSASKSNGYQSDDENVRYKLNTDFFNTASKLAAKPNKKQGRVESDDGTRYMFPKVLVKPLLLEKKPKQKIKVNFWSSKQSINRLHRAETKKEKSNRRHTIAVPSHDRIHEKLKNSSVKVRKRVSFLPSPLFSENHVPMLTVPDDLTIHLNEEEANDLGEDLHQGIDEESASNRKLNALSKKRSHTSTTQTSPKGTKRKQSSDESDGRNHGNENDLEFFSKYVVQKLRKMETNQRIYSENLINTVLMYGQLSKLNGKYKILEQ